MENHSFGDDVAKSNEPRFFFEMKEPSCVGNSC